MFHADGRTDRQADTHDEVNSRSLQVLCERLNMPKHLIQLGAGCHMAGEERTRASERT